MRFVLVGVCTIVTMSSFFATFTNALSSSSSSSSPTKSGGLRQRIASRSKKVRRHERVIFFPTAAHCQQQQQREGNHQENNDNNDNNDNDVTWQIPIHGWIFDDVNTKRNKLDPAQIEFGLRKRAFLSLLKRAVDRSIPEELIATDKMTMLEADDDDDDEEDEDDDTAMTRMDTTTNMAVKAIPPNGAENDNDDEEEIISQMAAKDKAAKQVIARRLFPFLVDNHRQRRMTIEFGVGGLLEPVELPDKSHKNGHFQSVVSLTQKQVDTLLATTRSTNGQDKLTFRAVTGIDNDERVFEGHAVLVPPKGLSVISDIDDTVKISHVLDMRKLIRLTFLSEFTAVPGMADLYKRWKQEKGAVFHFVSSSPWQLYTEIANFLQREDFPDASFHLKSIRLKDRTLFQLFSDPMSAKIAKIESILDRYPLRKFVLVGDTGERDPEVYGAICQKYPDAIEKVFLRDVTSDLTGEKVEALNEKNRKKGNGIVVNSPERYPQAFAGVPESKWMIFRDASEIEW